MVHKAVNSVCYRHRQYPLGRPLPSVRRLATELDVSVTTVALAYEELKQDGFVVARKRSGYFVNQDALTDTGHTLQSQLPYDIAPPDRIDYRAFFEDRSFNLERVVKPADCLVRYRYPFVCGLSDPSLFPLTNWRECVRDSTSAVEVRSWATDYSAIDDEVLIEQLTQRVLAKRGIVAHPDEVLVTMGGYGSTGARKQRRDRGVRLCERDPVFATGNKLLALTSPPTHRTHPASSSRWHRRPQ